jgi:hypothetical protein
MATYSNDLDSELLKSWCDLHEMTKRTLLSLSQELIYSSELTLLHPGMLHHRHSHVQIRTSHRFTLPSVSLASSLLGLTLMWKRANPQLLLQDEVYQKIIIRTHQH